MGRYFEGGARVKVSRTLSAKMRDSKADGLPAVRSARGKQTTRLMDWPPPQKMRLSSSMRSSSCRADSSISPCARGWKQRTTSRTGTIARGCQKTIQIFLAMRNHRGPGYHGYVGSDFA